MILAGAADLAIRSLMVDSPLLSRQTAEAVAVVEPIGEPVLDAAGNPIAVPRPASGGRSRPPLLAPLPGTVPPGSAAETIVVTDEYGVAHLPAPSAAATPTAATPAASPALGNPARPLAPPAPSAQGTAADGAIDPAYAAAVSADSGDPLDTPESPRTVTTLTGRPVRPRGRRSSRTRRRRA
jgi:hypothetical protein